MGVAGAPRGVSVRTWWRTIARTPSTAMARRDRVYFGSMASVAHTPWYWSTRSSAKEWARAVVEVGRMECAVRARVSDGGAPIARKAARSPRVKESAEAGVSHRTPVSEIRGIK